MKESKLTACQALCQQRSRLSIAFIVPCLAPVVVFFSTPAHADCKVERAVPWEWTLQQTIGAGKNKTNPLTVYNDGGWGFGRPGVRELLGNIVIGRNHNPQGACRRIDDLPDKANVKISWIITGRYNNNTFTKVPNIPVYLEFLKQQINLGEIDLGEYKTLVKVAADGLTFVDNDPPLEFEDPNGISAGDILKSRPGIIQLDWKQNGGVHPYTGSLNVETQYGFGIANFNGVKDEADKSFIQVDPFLEFFAVLAEPEVIQIRYLFPEPVPAPLPILGVGMAFGYGRRLRKLSRRLKSKPRN